MDTFSVVVGNIGTVYEGNDRIQALREFSIYRAMSLKGIGRVADEAVTLFTNGEVEKELPGRSD